MSEDKNDLEDKSIYLKDASYLEIKTRLKELTEVAINESILESSKFGYTIETEKGNYFQTFQCEDCEKTVREKLYLRSCLGAEKIDISFDLKLCCKECSIPY